MTEEWELYRYEQARTWLEAIRSLGERVDSTYKLVESMRDMLDGVKAIDPSSTRSSGSSADDAMIERIERLHENVRGYLALLAEYEDMRVDARRRISTMANDAERKALTYRFLLGYPWEVICVEMFYTHDGMMKLRRRAIVNAYEVMPLEWREPIHKAL